MRTSDPDAQGMVGRLIGPNALLGQAPRGDAAREEACPMSEPRNPDLGDLVIVLLAATLAGLRDRLLTDGFDLAAELVADLVEIADDYLTRVAA